MTEPSKLPDISDRNRWRLLLTVASGSVRSLFFDTHAKSLHFCGETAWQCPPAEGLRKIEDAIYDTPMLLDDYTTSLLLRPVGMLFVPSLPEGDEGEERAEELLSLVDATEQKDVWIEPLRPGLTAIFSTPPGVRDFLQRTFPTEDMHLALGPMCEHVCKAAADTLVWVHLDGGTLDIVAACAGHPLLLNTRQYNEPADAAYYIVRTIKALGLDAAATEVRVSCKDKLRAELTGMLRRHLGFVTVAVLPATLKASINGGASLCEVLHFNKN